MNIQALQHTPYGNYAYAYKKDELHIRLRTAKDDIKKVKLIYGGKFSWFETKSFILMKKTMSDEYFDYYECSLKCDDSRIGYFFELTDTEGKIQLYTEIGMLDEFDDNLGYCTFFQCAYINDYDVHKVPDWINDTVFYQIFVDRFCNGDKSNDPDNVVSWNAKPTPKNYFGGDLEGIIDKLDYIENLGINAIYLTPIFESKSNHKYDISNYMKIDKHFGDKDTLCRLVEKAHNKGIKIMLDAVFNHCSEDISFFQDVINNGENSKYKDWFIIKNFPISKEKINYEVFSFCDYMPKLNTDNPEVEEYLLSVADYWTKETGIDGWRLDVADEVNKNFWRKFRKKVKDINNNIIIIGESWHTALEWLRGDMYDSVMNYPVTRLVIDYFAKGTIDEKKLTYSLSSHLMCYSTQVNSAMLNLLDSHDTERFLTTCNNDTSKLMAASMFIFSYLGMPCVYYGTEIGMDGEYDPGCRKGFYWDEDKWDKKLHRFFKDIILLRRKEEALRFGNIKFHTMKNVFIMERKYKKQSIFMISNCSKDISSIDFRDIDNKIDGVRELISLNSVLKEDGLLLDIKPGGAGWYKCITE